MKRVVALCAVFLIAGCSVEQRLNEGNDKLDKMRGILEHAEDTLHLQVLASTYEALLSPANTAQLSPPTRMLPFAEVLGREATCEELVKLAHSFHQDALSRPKDQIRDAQVSMVALSAVAGLTPEAKVKELLAREVPDGRYEDTAYVFAVARYVFIRDLLFKPLFYASRYNRGILVEAVRLHSQMKALAQAPRHEQFLVRFPLLDLNERVDESEVRTLGAEARRKLGAVPEISGGSENKKLLEELG